MVKKERSQINRNRKKSGRMEWVWLALPNKRANENKGIGMEESPQCTWRGSTNHGNYSNSLWFVVLSLGIYGNHASFVPKIDNPLISLEHCKREDYALSRKLKQRQCSVTDLLPEDERGPTPNSRPTLLEFSKWVLESCLHSTLSAMHAKPHNQAFCFYASS